MVFIEPPKFEGWLHACATLTGNVNMHCIMIHSIRNLRQEAVNMYTYAECTCNMYSPVA